MRKAYTPEQLQPFIGEFKLRGVYQIIFAPVQGEFNDKDQARDAARHSAWNQDREFTDYTIKFVKSTVTPQTHPFVCGSCGDYVSPHAEGKCGGCGENNWVRRK